jgi:hypothetical protein
MAGRKQRRHQQEEDFVSGHCLRLRFLNDHVGVMQTVSPHLLRCG